MNNFDLQYIRLDTQKKRTLKKEDETFKSKGQNGISEMRMSRGTRGLVVRRNDPVKLVE